VILFLDNFFHTRRLDVSPTYSIARISNCSTTSRCLIQIFEVEQIYKNRLAGPPQTLPNIHPIKNESKTSVARFDQTCSRGNR